MSTPFKTSMKLMTVAIAAACALGAASSASAQISGDVVKIGIITDLSGLYSDIDGQGGAEAIKMAIADFGGSVNGKKIEFLSADHQNKPDIAAGKAREWFDQQGVDMLIGGTNSGTGLAVSKAALEKKKLYISIGAGTARLTNEECSPYTIHYAYDTVALAKGTGAAVVKQGGKSWYFLTADYAFGASLEGDTAAVVKANGGTVLGSVKHPLSASDFSSFMLQAQASKAQILGLANAGGDTINSIKQAAEFGLTRGGRTRLAGLLVFITDIHSLGLPTAQGLVLTETFYWDLNDKTRAFTTRMGAMPGGGKPTMVQAGCYSGVLHYLKAVAEMGVAAAKVSGAETVARMKSMPTDDDAFGPGTIRSDGRKLHPSYLFEVKTPAESRAPWDYYKLLGTTSAEESFRPVTEGGCALPRA